MKKLFLEAVASACNGEIYKKNFENDDMVAGVVTDSRFVEAGYLFIALRGEKTDGHKYIKQVFEKGAVACVVEEIPEDVQNGIFIKVESCFQALKDIAAFYRESLRIKVIGIAGSVGKTSTKEMVASVLEQKYSVQKTKGNYNNEIGVPFTIFTIEEEHEIVVLEMGISDFGEMHRLSKIAKPDMCVMTNIGQCHLENLKDRDGILKAKSEIFDFASSTCMAVLNGDDEKLYSLKDKKNIQPYFYGMGYKNDIYAEHIEDLGMEGMRFDICTSNRRIQVQVSIPGMHMVYNALAGAAVGLNFGMELSDIKKGIESLKPTSGRNNIIKSGKRAIIDDCYNANPVSMQNSLDVLSKAVGHKSAILGDMGELGENEELLHYKIGEYIVEKDIDLLICVGKLSEYIKQGAEAVSSNMRIIYYKDLKECLQNYKKYLSFDDTILIKASHFMQFYKIVEDLT